MRKMPLKAYEAASKVFIFHLLPLWHRSIEKRHKHDLLFKCWVIAREICQKHESRCRFEHCKPAALILITHFSLHDSSLCFLLRIFSTITRHANYGSVEVTQGARRCILPVEGLKGAYTLLESLLGCRSEKSILT